jgi:DNA-directed RNA polymerase I, II, and III subunit RPABC2
MSYFEDDEKDSIYGGSDNASDDSDDESIKITSKKLVANDDDELHKNGEDDEELEEELEEDDDDLDEDLDEDVEEEEDIQSGGAKDDDLEEGEIDEEAENAVKRKKKVPAKITYKKPDVEEDEEDDEDDDGEQYLQKFDRAVNDNYIVDFHPECVLQNYDEILSMVKVLRDRNGIIIDDLHRTIPFLTKYERARILGQRAKQINAGSPPFVKVPENVIDGYVIAELELKEKRIPFIIRRPLPNGGSEYWSLKDLEDISF